MALRILERFRLRLNLQNRFGLPVTFDAFADEYVEKELPLLRYGTQQAHLSSLHRWIRPRWGCIVYEIKPIQASISAVGGEINGKPAEPFAPRISARTAVGDNRR